MKFLIKSLFLIAAVSQFVTASDMNDMGEACMIQMLKDKGQLERDFPTPTRASHCGLVQLMIDALENGFYEKFNSKESIEAECAKKELKQRHFINYAIKKEIIESSKLLSHDKIRSKTLEVRTEIKSLLDSVAEVCDSDPTWAGIFDEFLGATNTSQAALEQKYCFLKLSMDKNLINIENLDVNPNHIDTKSVDCEAVIQARKDEIEKELTEKFQEKGLPRSKLNCVVNTLKQGDFFDTTVAIETLEKLDIDPVIRAENKEKLSKSLESGLVGIFSCML